MKEYDLSRLTDSRYCALLVCLTFESILNYLDKIQNETIICNNEGDVLIDQLLVTGNGRNRYIRIHYCRGKILLDSAQNVDVDEMFRQKSVEVFRKYFDMINNSILTEEQRNMIENGTPF